jgi:hypothetical protein
MSTVAAWIVDPQGRAVPGVDVELTAQGWRGQRWWGRSDQRGAVRFDVPPMALRGGGRWTVAVPGIGARAVGDLKTPLRLVVPVRTAAPVQAQSPAQNLHAGSDAASQLLRWAQSADRSGRQAAALRAAMASASPAAVQVGLELASELVAQQAGLGASGRQP